MTVYLMLTSIALLVTNGMVAANDLDCGLFCRNTTTSEGQVIDCSGHDLTKEVWNCIPTTTIHLKLQRMKITDLPAEAFRHMAALKSLDLSENEIVELPERLFFNLTSLHFLFLQNNFIKSIPKDLFANLSSLKSLFIGGNRLREIPEQAFKKLRSLEMISLRKNDLHKIPDEAFKNLTRLKIIMLSDNPIETIGSQAFTIPNGNLLLYMIRTELKTVTLRSFDGMNISLEEGKLGILKFTDGTQTSTLHLGVEEDDSEYVDLSDVTWPIKDTLLLVFKQAGFANQTGSEYKLLPCPLGTFLNSSAYDSNALKCLECPAGGFYSDTQAFVNTSCRSCENGTFVHYDKAPGKSRFDCTACPQGTDTNAFAGFRACRCLNNFYRTHMFEGCKPCSQRGLKCLDDGIVLESGFWWQWRNDTRQELYRRFTDNLMNASFSPALHANTSEDNASFIAFQHELPRPYRCPLKEACKGGLDSSCLVGYEGPLCAVCSKGYYKQLKKCKLCPTKKLMAGQLSIIAVVIAIVTVLVIWGSKKKSKKSTGRSFLDICLGRIKIVVGFYQVTFGVLEAFSYIKWPESLSVIGKYSEIIQLNVLQIAPIHCIVPALNVDALGSLFGIMGLNGAAIVVAFASFGLIKLISRRNNLNEEEKAKKMARAKQAIYRNLFFFLYVTYLSTCFKIAQVLPLACRKLCVDETEEQCQTFLKADYNIKCTSTRYTRLVNFAYFAVSYVVLLPTASLIAVWRQRRVIRATENETENEARDAEESGTEDLMGLRFLYENYNPRVWYWELVETARKVILTSGLILVGGESRAYVGLACVMSGLYGMFFGLKRPILDPFENKLMLTSLAVTFVNLGIGAVSRIPKEGIPSSIDPYVDNIMFSLLVFGANSLVIGLLVVQYLMYIHRYIKEWRKNPKWSLSCCLALLLPLNDLQGEIRGLAGRNILKQQLQSGGIDMPTMARTFKDSGAGEFALEDDTSSPKVDSGQAEVTSNERQDIEQGVLILAKVSIHELPRGTCDTKI